MKITRENYEIFFLDYLDGNLEQEVVNDLLEFVQNNPDLKDELQMISNVKVDAEEIIYEGKEKLFREKYDQNEDFDQTAIAAIEDDLTEAEKLEFERYLASHPQKMKEMSDYKLTKLLPDPAIAYNKKHQLYHHHPRKVFLLWLPRIAAVLIIGLIVYMVYDNAGLKEQVNVYPFAVSEQQDIPQDVTPAPEPPEVPPNPIPQIHEKLMVDNQFKNEPKQTDHIVSEDKSETKGFTEPVERVVIEMPELIQSRSAVITDDTFLLASLEPVIIDNVPDYESEPEELLLGDLVRERTGLNNLTLKDVAKAGLALVSAITKDKVSYETNDKGQITELSMETRMLAFSIPTGTE